MTLFALAFVIPGLVVLTAGIFSEGEGGSFGILFGLGFTGAGVLLFGSGSPRCAHAP
jgi:hypothetical protein